MMEEISVLKRSDINKRVRTTLNESKLNSEASNSNPVIDNLIAEGGENFYNYLNLHGLVNEPNSLVLSSNHFYFYDSEELKGVKTLISLKRLNLIKHLDDFLQTVCYILSPKTNFIGCFSDRKIQNGSSLSIQIYESLINILDSRINIKLDKKKIHDRLESNGFNVIDMTEINGLTYFRAQIS
jgi:hypothetical protein